jgi:transcriptional regulator with XRE-family HTH domain
VSQRICKVKPAPPRRDASDRGKQEPEMVRLGGRIKELRQRAGLSQSGLAATLGFRQEVMSWWERGQRMLPAVHVPALAAALGVTIGELFTPAAGPRPRHVV